MNILTINQDQIEFSLGSNRYDNCPTQKSVQDFKAFTEAIWANGSDKKGMTYICAPFEVGLHSDPAKHPGEKTWRQKHLVKPRRFLSLDIDGMTPPTWVWLRTWLQDKGINCCWYTTASHTLGNPRVRLVVELDRPVSREDGVVLAQALEIHIQQSSPYNALINFDQSVHKGEQPFYLPVVNDETQKETQGDKYARFAIYDKKPLDVDYFLSLAPKELTKPNTANTTRPAVGAWQQKSLTEQTEHIEAFKQALRDWAEAGSRDGFASDSAKAKEAELRQVGGIWNWCWVFDELSRADVLAELLKTPVNELGDQGRTKWLATMMLAARLAPAGSNDAEHIKQQVFDWSERHECYEDDYDAALDEFEKVWDEGESTTSETNLPIKLLFNLRKQKKHLPQLLMADGSLFDVLARPVDISDMFGMSPRQTPQERQAGYESLFGKKQTTPEPVQGVLFEPVSEEDRRAQEKFPFWDVASIRNRPAIKWRIKNVFPTTGLAAIYGPSASGKTFLALDLLARVSLGLEFFGRKTTPCPAIYVCLEGTAGISNRVKAWEEKHQVTLPDSFRIMPEPLSLTNQDAQQFALAIKLSELDGGVIVIDTLNQSAPTADENSSKDMGIIIQNAQTIQRLTNSLVILVHHTGKDTSRGLRGHSSLFAALDGAIEVKKSLLGPEWALTKAKDAETIAGQSFTLYPVPLGMDDEGQPINCCVVMPNKTSIFQPPPPTGKNQKIVLAALRGLLVDKVSISRAEFVERVKHDLGGQPKRQGARATEALDGLISSGHVFEIEQGILSLERPKTASPFF